MPRRLLVLLLVFMACGCNGPQDESASKDNVTVESDLPATAPLAPLASIAAHIDQGASTFLEGKSMEESFQPWITSRDPGSERGKSAEIEFRRQLTAVGAASIKIIGFEYKFLFVRGDRSVYDLSTFVVFDGENVKLLSVEGSERDSSAAGGMRPNEYRGDAGPFGQAAQSLLDVIRNGDGESLPVVDVDAYLDRSGFPAEFAAGIRSTAEVGSLSDACRGIAKLDYSDVYLRLDRPICIVKNAQGETVGMASGSLDAVKDGRLGFFLRFQTLANK